MGHPRCALAAGEEDISRSQPSRLLNPISLARLLLHVSYHLSTPLSKALQIVDNLPIMVA
jgi:hypothetical protein